MNKLKVQALFNGDPIGEPFEKPHARMTEKRWDETLQKVVDDHKLAGSFHQCEGTIDPIESPAGACTRAILSNRDGQVVELVWVDEEMNARFRHGVRLVKMLTEMANSHVPYTQLPEQIELVRKQLAWVDEEIECIHPTSEGRLFAGLPPEAA